MTYKIKATFVKQPLESLMEAIDERGRKTLYDMLVKRASSAPFMSQNPEDIRKLRDVIVAMTDVSPLGTHMVYAIWVIDQYLKRALVINPNSANPDEDDIKQKLTIFDQVRRTKTPVPFKQWSNQEDQWKIQNYTVGDLNQLVRSMEESEIQTDDSGEADLENKYLTATDPAEVERLEALLFKKRAVKRSEQYTRLVYQDDTHEIFLILGGPTIGLENPAALRSAGIAWHELGKGASWCVAAGAYDENDYGKSYLKSSDVLICRENKKPKFSLQYEGSQLDLKDVNNQDILRDVKETPLGDFTLITIPLEPIESLEKGKKTLAEFFFKVYPSLDLSESVTFGSKQIVLLPKDGKNDELSGFIYKKIRSMGYASLKEYAVSVYPTVLNAYYFKHFGGKYGTYATEESRRLEGVTEYTNPKTVKSLELASQHSDDKYLMHLLFKYREAIEEDILNKDSANLAALYLQAVSEIIPSKFPELLKTKEFSKFSQQRANDDDD